MKYILNYFLLLLLASLITVSCKRKTNSTNTNPNLSQGVYISGTATVFTAIGAAATFDVAHLDDFDNKATGAGIGVAPKGIASHPTVLEKYVWLKAGGTFTITISDANKVNTVYGKGTVTTPTTNTRFTTYNMVKDATGFTVPADGFYFLIVCTQNNQLTIAPAKWGINIGSEIPMDVAPYNPTTNEVVFSKTLDIPKTASFKFRFSGDWGIGKIPFTTTVGDSVTIHSDVASADGTLSATNYGSILSTSGKDMGVSSSANYSVYFKYNVATSVFSAYAKNNGDPVNPTLPDNLYITGGSFTTGGANYTAPVIMQPAGGGAMAFWAIVYFDGNSSNNIKLSPTTSATDAKAFGMTGSEVIIGTEHVYGRGTTNIPEPPSAGYYMVTYKFVDGATHDSISIKPAEVYVYGIAPPAHTGKNWNWESIDQLDKFTETGTAPDSKVLTSPPFAGAGTLRMATYSRWIPNAWASEFMVVGGKIVYRGAGGDIKPDVSVTETNTVTLNFIKGTGTITP